MLKRNIKKCNRKIAHIMSYFLYNNPTRDKQILCAIEHYIYMSAIKTVTSLYAKTTTIQMFPD